MQKPQGRSVPEFLKNSTEVSEARVERVRGRVEEGDVRGTVGRTGHAGHWGSQLGFEQRSDTI